jgi:menaquinone-dependent protoporphyrinogen oxidase
MPRILVLYGTTEGHTRKVANAIGDTMRANGLDVDVVHVDESEPDPSGYSAVIVAASVHAGGYQKPIASWVRAHAAQLDRIPGAFVSVCLSVLSKNAVGRQEAEAIPRRFLDGTHWHPARVKIVAGALLYTHYNFLVRWIVKRIVATAGGDTDTSRDYEYTDWNDVRAFAGDFGRSVIDRAAA